MKNHILVYTRTSIFFFFHLWYKYRINTSNKLRIKTCWYMRTGIGGKIFLWKPLRFLCLHPQIFQLFLFLPLYLSFLLSACKFFNWTITDRLESISWCQFTAPYPGNRTTRNLLRSLKNCSFFFVCELLNFIFLHFCTIFIPILEFFLRFFFSADYIPIFCELTTYLDVKTLIFYHFLFSWR